MTRLEILPLPLQPEFEFQRRTVVVDGKLTSLSMERIYWNGFDRLAKANNLRWRQVVAIALAHKPREYKSRAGWLRVWMNAKSVAAARRQGGKAKGRA